MKIKNEIVEDNSKYIFDEKDLHGGTQIVYKFDNGYGASVIQNKYSYGGDVGLYELAVIEFEGLNWDLTYETPITDDVIGRLTVDALVIVLEKIKALPKKGVH